MSDYFKDIPTIKYEGRDSRNPLSFKFYDANKISFNQLQIPKKSIW